MYEDSLPQRGVRCWTQDEVTGQNKRIRSIRLRRTVSLFSSATASRRTQAQSDRENCPPSGNPRNAAKTKHRMKHVHLLH